MNIAIAELHPSEPSVIRSKVANLVAKYQSDPDAVARPEVARIQNCWLVVEGNNRVFAAREAGLTTIEVKDSTPIDSGRLAYLSTLLAQAIAANHQGFDEVPIDDSMSGRGDRY